MPGEETPRAPFDERAALEELERLKNAVEESRRRRKDASAAFDDFVSSFRKSPGDDASRAHAGGESRPLPTRLQATDASLPQWPVTRRKPLPLAWALAGGVVAVTTGLVLTRAWRTSPGESADPRTSVQAPAAGALASPSPRPPASATAAPGIAGALQAELVAVRDVWVRATADGVRVVERELEAKARVPLRATRTIVIRAGDAGAVRMTINGEDRGPLGADGVVVTRTYTAPAASVR